MSDTSPFTGRHTVSETRAYTPEGQATQHQITNASGYIGALGDQAGSGEAHAASLGAVDHAHAVARPPGSWMPPMGNALRSTTNILDDAGTSAPKGPGLFGR